MGYIFYSVSFFFLIVATGRTSRLSDSLLLQSTNTFPVLYATRSLWISHAPPIPYLTAPGTVPEPIYNAVVSFRSIFSAPRYSRLNNFASDIEEGFSSSNFDLRENVEAGDSRAGLDDRGKKEVQRIMKARNVGFDEARRIFIEERFGRNNIGKDGRPTDPKAFMFDR